MDRFDAMQAFALVVEAGSFAKAAETLQLSKTSVTQLVQQLEARLRVKLLNRTTRKANVTADGAAYYERVVRRLADMDDAETSLSSAHLARGELLLLFEDWHLDPMPMYLAYAPNRHVGAKLRVFIDWVDRLMAPHAPIAGRADVGRSSPPAR
jgi:DNA-binding transcriptional LysR family regulator